MDNLIDKTYFYGLITLPFLNLNAEVDTPSEGVIFSEEEELNAQIAYYQKRFLKKLFGSEVVPDLVADMLVDRKLRKSPIANYVFCNLLMKYEQQNTAQGVKTTTGENTQANNYKWVIDEAWNEMVEMNGEIREYMSENGIDYEYPTNYECEIYNLSYFI